MTQEFRQHIEISREAYRHNITTFRRMLPPGCAFMAVVKANAYGHGLLPVAHLAVAEGVDMLGVDCLEEAVALREDGIETPIMVLGYIPLDQLAAVIHYRLTPVVYHAESLHRLAVEAESHRTEVAVHLKLETGLHRQGVTEEELGPVLEIILRCGILRLAGLSMHFANIEDTTDHRYARRQLELFRNMARRIQETTGLQPQLHTACSAAVILFGETHFDLVRVGLGGYGLWPSKETYLSTILKDQAPPVLKTVLCWKSRLAQVKAVPADAFIGYGCSYRTTQPLRMAVVPVGYYDGYDRRLSSQGHVLVRGRRAPVLGRVCMNMIMVDVTHVAGAAVDDEVVLLGRQGEESVTADEMAALCHTINYEIVARLGAHIPRIVVD
ncbi:MAG: alanine racemase [Acidobacteria bacterium]|nr:alanine racemase [Acidobacteriota bacterium]